MNVISLKKRFEQQIKEVSIINPLQLLNIIFVFANTGNDTTIIVQLMQVRMNVNRLDIMATIDIGATHTFISLRVVHDYKLKTSKCPSDLKIVITKLQVVNDITYRVVVTIKGLHLQDKYSGD